MGGDRGMDIREKIAEYLTDFYDGWIPNVTKESIYKANIGIAEQILTLETETQRIAVVEKDAKLPENPWADFPHHSLYKFGQEDMLTQGWVKEIKA